jgi:hypothetical protein
LKVSSSEFSEGSILRSINLCWTPANFSFLNFKGTSPQEEHKTVFGDLNVCKMALSNQIDFLAFFHLRKCLTGNSLIPEFNNPLSP